MLEGEGYNSIATTHLILKFSFVSFVPFISAFIQRGVAPRPDQVCLGSLLAAKLRSDLSALEGFALAGLAAHLTRLAHAGQR
jgi:hypothetical protein